MAVILLLLLGFHRVPGHSCFEGIRRLHQLFFTKSWNYADLAYFHVFLHQHMDGEEWTYSILYYNIIVFLRPLAWTCCQSIQFAHHDITTQPPWISIHFFSKYFPSLELTRSLALTSSFFRPSYCAIRVGLSGLLRVPCALRLKLRFTSTNTQIVCCFSVFHSGIH